MKPGDRVLTPLGPGVLNIIGGVPPGAPNPDYPGWTQVQVVVVRILEKSYLFGIDEISVDLGPESK